MRRLISAAGHPSPACAVSACVIASPSTISRYEIVYLHNQLQRCDLQTIPRHRLYIQSARFRRGAGNSTPVVLHAQTRHRIPLELKE
jgi:hypothetical protein